MKTKKLIQGKQTSRSGVEQYSTETYFSFFSFNAYVLVCLSESVCTRAAMINRLIELQKSHRLKLLDASEMFL